MYSARRVADIGINDVNYRVNDCPIYKTWKTMLHRCKRASVGYENVSVDSRWHYFSNFRAWMEKQDWEGKHLDKDFKNLGNSVYGPENCIFIPQELNNFLTLRDKNSKDRLIGCSYREDCKMWRSKISHEGTRRHLGYFKTEIEAHLAWLSEKIILVEVFMAKYENDQVILSCLCQLKAHMKSCLENKTPYRRFYAV